MPTKRKQEIKSVSSVPAKSFFVSMLTRDIDLQDAVLDLLDNCVDGAIRTRSKEKADEDSLKDFWAHIKFNKQKFVIEDNCGGIPWKLADNYAFRMGRPEEVEPEPGTIGVVGIGMKRAIFKLGRECYVHSNHKDDAFLVTIPPEWFQRDDLWQFDAKREEPATHRFGTIIEVTELTDSAALAFGAGSEFRATFPATVAEAYSLLIQKGFRVTINEDEVRPRPVRLCFEEHDNPKKDGELIRPYIYNGRMDGVDVFLAVGYRSRLPTATEQDDEAKASFAAREAGWTIACNDRVVLSNDRSIKTGWGFAGVPNFHNQFSCIAGIVEFRSQDMAKLPITTTKRGVDTGKDIYTLVRQRMQEGLKQFTRNTNRWKGFEAELKHRFDGASVLDLKQLKRLSKKLPLTSLIGDGVQKQYKPQLPERKRVQTTRRIAFVKKITDIQQVSEYLFSEIREPNEVGERCFDKTLREAKR